MKTFWAHEDDEEGKFETIDEAIEDYLEFMEDRPLEITMVQYKPVEVNRGLLNPLEYILDVLDDEYGGEFTKPTQKMLDAEKALIDAVLEVYVPESVSAIAHRRVDVHEWCRKNHPEWIGED